MTTTTLGEFIRNTALRMTHEYAAENPHMEDRGASADNYKCVIRAGKHQMTVYFSKGTGHNGAAPTLEEVLDCLAMDAAGYENAGSFEEWAAGYWYDTDSRKAEKSYNVIGKQADALKGLLGEANYKTLLYDCERE